MESSMIDEALTDRPSRDWRSDLRRIGFIMLLALLTRGWIIAHTEVISRDGIGFIRYALQIETPPLTSGDDPRPMTRSEVLRASFHPPGYSLSIVAASRLVRPFVADERDAMRLSAQIASLLASLTLVAPMYFLGKLLFDRQTAFVGTLLFQMLPVSSQVASDGLSDNLFLCLMAFALWFGALALREQRLGWSLAAGFASGLSYLVRPEGMLLLAALGVVMFWQALRGESRWRSFLANLLALGVGALLVAGPYIATIGRLTNKPTGEQLFQWLSGEKMKPSWISERPVHFPLAAWFKEIGAGQEPGTRWATEALAAELLKAGFYTLPFFALIGGWVVWPKLRRDPAGSLVVVVATLHSLLLWRMAKGAGYVAERHTLLVVMCASFFAAAALPFMGEKLASAGKLRRLGGASFWSAALATGLVLAQIPSSLKTLHQNRAGHREAGRWIADQRTAHERSFVLDPFAWAEYYAGYVRLPAGIDASATTMYIVVEGPAHLHPRLHTMHFAKFFAARGEAVWQWPAHVPLENAKVIVYRWRGDNLPHLWMEASCEHAAKKGKTP
jgi:hypothetical protein